MTVATPITVGRGEEEAAARAWVALLEKILSEHPTQWFNFFDVWSPFGELSAGADRNAGAPAP